MNFTQTANGSAIRSMSDEQFKAYTLKRQAEIAKDSILNAALCGWDDEGEEGV